jgi:gliding motility-associated-like protein
MRYLTLLFTFLCLNVYSQQIVRLCPDEPTEFRYYSHSVYPGTFTWTSNGQTFNGDEIVVKWTKVGDYILTLEFENLLGCTTIETYDINVVECPITTFYIPNSFTPNFDGINDAFKPFGVNYYKLEFSIYNRWGELIFYTDDENTIGWNGGYEGYMCPEGIYVYIVKWSDERGFRQIKTGNINLIR